MFLCRGLIFLGEEWLLIIAVTTIFAIPAAETVSSNGLTFNEVAGGLLGTEN